MGHLAELLEASKLDLSQQTLGQLAAFRDRLLQAATQFNLTALRDAEGIERRHLLESLALGRLLDQRGLLEPGARMLDLGTGAGLPGLPIKLAWPQVQLTLLDAHGKRCQFLRETIEALQVDSATVAEGRAEDLGRDPMLRESFDLVIARAVAPLPVLLEYAMPLLKVGGALVASKGSAAEAELESAEKALRELGSKVEAFDAFLPPDGMPQHLLIVRKTEATSERYPRRSGIPSKRPL